MTTQELVTTIRTAGAEERRDAWYAAGPIGAPALAPLASVMAETDAVDVEVARAAKNAMWRIVRFATRPDAGTEDTRAVIHALLLLLHDDRPDFIRSEVLWMLSEIGGDESVDPIAKVLMNPALLEDARCALERIPGEKSIAALQAALTAVPEKYRSNIAQTLRMRGVKLDERRYPCMKLVPTRFNSVQPAN